MTLYEAHQIKQREQTSPGQLVVKTTSQGFYLMTLTEHKAMIAELKLKEAFEKLSEKLTLLCARAKRDDWNVIFEERSDHTFFLSYDLGSTPREDTFSYNNPKSIERMHRAIATMKAVVNLGACA